MNMTRRNWLARAASLSLASKMRFPLFPDAAQEHRLPAKADFPVVENEVCLNNAHWHPLSAGSMHAIQEYLDYKSRGAEKLEERERDEKAVKASFAQLIGAKPTEISFVQSTTVGENLIVSGLGLPASGGNIVTDLLHFEGSLYLYDALQKQGLDVRVVKPREWRIELSDLEKVVDGETKLVALSLVSFINGFQHDLKAVCDLAHAHGAHVYADIIQAAGAIPLDVHAAGVDFCACASYKWLMGDMGLGFLYVREDLLDRVIRRTQYGYRQLSHVEYHVFPYDRPGAAAVEWTQAPTAEGHFEIGTVSNTTVACLSHSLRYIQQLGVEKIQAHAQSLLARIRKELPAMGFELITPAGTTGPIVTFLVKQPEQVAARLKRANVNVALSGHRIRISPSVYNDQSDVDKLLQVLA